jgi:alpha-glucosidase
MPWDTSANAGFTSGEPWLPLNSDWRERNVARLAEAADSPLALHRSLLALRRAHPALSVGDITLLESEPGADDVLAYERRSGDDRVLVALNLGTTSQTVTLPEWARRGRVLLSTIDGAPAPRERIELRPDEGLVVGPRA